MKDLELIFRVPDEDPPPPPPDDDDDVQAPPE